MNKTTVYKIVHKFRGKLISGYTGYYKAKDNGDASILEYSPSIVTVPKFGKIFAFDTFQRAKAYLGVNTSEFEIWEAVATGPIVRCRRFHITMGDDNTSEMKMVWSKKKKSHVIAQTTPTGTILCENLQLVKRLLPV